MPSLECNCWCERPAIDRRFDTADPAASCAGFNVTHPNSAGPPYSTCSLEATSRIRTSQEHVQQQGTHLSIIPLILPILARQDQHHVEVRYPTPTSHILLSTNTLAAPTPPSTAAPHPPPPSSPTTLLHVPPLQHHNSNPTTGHNLPTNPTPKPTTHPKAQTATDQTATAPPPPTPAANTQHPFSSPSNRKTTRQPPHSYPKK